MTSTILKGGDELFEHKDVLRFYNRVINEWDFDSKKTALLLGCTLHKPYSRSFMHKKVIAMLRKHKLDSVVQQYIIGEPLVVCPREWEEAYPAAHYDFPPEELGRKGEEIFIIRLRNFLTKIKNHYSSFVVFVPNHHRDIILTASNNIIEPNIVPYNVYKLIDLLAVLRSTIDKER